MYYKPNSCGYTDYTTCAGIYTKEEAVQEARSVDEIHILPIDLKSHNEKLENEIKSLQSRLINV